MWNAIPAEPAWPADDGSPAPGRWRRRVRQCERPGPAGIWLLCTGLRQKRSQGDSDATKTLVRGAEVKDSCPRKGGSEGARVSMSMERIPTCRKIDWRDAFGRVRPIADVERSKRRCLSLTLGRRGEGLFRRGLVPDSHMHLRTLPCDLPQSSNWPRPGRRNLPDRGRQDPVTISRCEGFVPSRSTGPRCRRRSRQACFAILA